MVLFDGRVAASGFTWKCEQSGKWAIVQKNPTGAETTAAIEAFQWGKSFTINTLSHILYSQVKPSQKNTAVGCFAVFNTNFTYRLILEVDDASRLNADVLGIDKRQYETSVT